MNKEIVAKIKISRELLEETKKVARQLSYSSVNEYILDCVREINSQWEKKAVELLEELGEKAPQPAPPLEAPISSPLDVFDEIDFDSLHEHNQDESDSEIVDEEETEPEFTDMEVPFSQSDVDPFFIEKKDKSEENQEEIETIDENQEIKEDSFKLIIPEDNTKISEDNEKIDEYDQPVVEKKAERKFVSSLLVDEWIANPPDPEGNILTIHTSNIYAIEIQSNGQAILLENDGGTGWMEPEEPFSGDANKVKKEAEKRLNS